VLSTQPEGLRVVVTGAAGGVGTAVVEHLLACRCTAAALDLGFQGWPLASEPGVHCEQVDLGDWEAVGEGVERSAASLGGIDAVVCAAAIIDNLHRAQNFGRSDWQRELDVNLSGAFRVAQAAYPHLRAAGAGRVVIVSSMAAELGQPGQVAYSASKAGLVGMVRTLGVEWAADGITSVAVLPGVVETPKVRRLPAAIRDRYRQQVPIHRFALVEELAGVIAFLLSPAAAYINGTVIRVDGGMGLNLLSLAAGRTDPETLG
jgi:NAD(P)-dependent dehydrogenase (short-subunit alcohol dehydrogenase family)